MQMNFVESSNLNAVGYEDSSLFIRFNSGGLYEYMNVPKSIYLELLSAPSKGEYHARYIKHSYPFRRL